ncbi:demethoxyubiquinone hydroxylase family protein [Alphaproteobacteria bacterium]|nr:demethoxyubiquinone hydroxylase family protein [Alphaproteobacteria bacterium]
MSDSKIIESYKASNVVLPKKMIGWIRSNHAGETGAVWIYLGARCVFWNKNIKIMSKEHYQTEKNHLIVMNHLLLNKSKSKLLILWRFLGFNLGLISALFGYRFFCVTIQSVETFVEKHYQEQITFLYKKSIAFDLLKVLEICCNEEVEHQIEARENKGYYKNNNIEKLWANIIGLFSNIAVKVSKTI